MDHPHKAVGDFVNTYNATLRDLLLDGRIKKAKNVVEKLHESFLPHDKLQTHPDGPTNTFVYGRCAQMTKHLVKVCSEDPAYSEIPMRIVIAALESVVKEADLLLVDDGHYRVTRAQQFAWKE